LRSIYKNFYKKTKKIYLKPKKKKLKMKESETKIFQYNLETELKKDFPPKEEKQQTITIEEKTASNSNNNKIINTKTNKDFLNNEAKTMRKLDNHEISESDISFFQVELLNKTDLETINNTNNLNILNLSNKIINRDSELSNENNISKLNYSEFIEKLGFTRKAYKVYLLANFLQFIWGMEACFIAINLERLATNSAVPLGTKSGLISLLYAMLGIGSALMGHLTKLLGRIKLIVISTIVYCLFIVLCSAPLIEGFYVIYAFRCIANIALGIFNISILNLLTEYLPIKKRSYVLMVNSGLYNFGNIFVILVNNIFLADMNKNFEITSWRVINLLCVIPGLISLVFSIFYVEESPLYLINNEHRDENNSQKAYKILKEMSVEKKAEFNESFFNAIKNNTRNMESFKLKSNYSELFHSKYIRLTICNILICTICYFNMIGISYVIKIRFFLFFI
jgi:MFS family permease